MLDLMLPLQCGGCGAPATPWCAECERALTVQPDEPHLVTPRIDPGVPVLSLGRYAGPRRKAIVAVKEHGRTDLIRPLAHALHDGLVHLLTWGILERPLTVVPAPTKHSSARKRGGDPVTRIAQLAVAGSDPGAVAGTDPDAVASPDLSAVASPDLSSVAGTGTGLSVVAALRLKAFTRDSVGLSSAGRQRNIAGRVRRIGAVDGPVLLVDDIVTTGATAAESVHVLQTGGAHVVAVLALANA
ncbi:MULTISPECIES: ComF family protein [Mycobacteriaceae]|uniref:ComF family protein n=1 Tax=Mycolicibacterium parafortuitum TaxID=39692 RepID=A0ACC6MJD2_MYCPF|nr:MULTISPECIES: ComF family protein [Mycobacteriaceae]MDZ5087038.1 ComF family protein [Mycolicibacterium parafortuitum]GFM19527.1 amidophosphoribosyltransferase [Mycobacterium sp. PO1]GFM23018.1 amidophosphoribosyltransferase [Mycobacterium sp. PO2]